MYLYFYCYIGRFKKKNYRRIESVSVIKFFEGNCGGEESWLWKGGIITRRKSPVHSLPLPSQYETL